MSWLKHLKPHINMLVAESFQDTPAVYFRLSELLCWQTLLLTVRLQSCVWFCGCKEWSILYFRNIQILLFNQWQWSLAHCPIVSDTDFIVTISIKAVQWDDSNFEFKKYKVQSDVWGIIPTKDTFSFQDWCVILFLLKPRLESIFDLIIQGNHHEKSCNQL